MIRIRNLTPTSIASLVVQSAEEQLASRAQCKRTHEIYREPQILLLTESQKERRPQ
jgi:hypothetical protein